MYVGHVGIALALRAERHAPPLWLLALAAEGPDWGDAVCGALHISASVPPAYGPHSLIFVSLGAIVAAIVAHRVTRHANVDRGMAALIAALAYLSHWIVDCITGIKPTWPGGPMIGLKGYSHPIRDLALEGAFILIGWLLWRRSLPPRRNRGNALAIAMLAALLALQAMADVVMARMADPSWPTIIVEAANAK